MAKTIEQLKTLLSFIEPEPSLNLEITIEDIPNLAKLSLSKDLIISMRAVEQLSKINDDDAFKAIQTALKQDIPVLKIAAALGAKYYSKSNFNKLIPKLLEDQDVGVRKVTLNSLPKVIDASVKLQVKKMIVNDKSEMIQKLAKKISQK